MKSFVKYSIALLLTAAAFTLGAAPMANVRSNGIIDVKTPHYSLSFFPGCMFPFRPAAGGESIQEPYWFDRICGEDGTWYFLRVERFAKREILVNTPEQLKIRMSGNFCFDDDTSAPGLPGAVYTYTCTQDKVTLAITLQNPEKKVWKDVYLFAPVWQRHSWTDFTADQQTVKPSATGIPAKKSASLGNAKHNITLFSGTSLLFADQEIPVTDAVKRDLFPAPKLQFTGFCGIRIALWHDAELSLPEMQLQIRGIQ